MSEKEVQQGVLKQLKTLILPIQINKVGQGYHNQNQRTTYLIVKTKYKDKETTFVIEVKTIGEPRYIQQAITQVKVLSKEIPNSYPVVASSCISETSQKICKNSNVGYIDLLGNVYIDLPHIHLEKESKKSQYETKDTYKPSKESKKSQYETKELLFDKLMKKYEEEEEEEMNEPYKKQKETYIKPKATFLDKLFE